MFECLVFVMDSRVQFNDVGEVIQTIFAILKCTLIRVSDIVLFVVFERYD